ncbi:putative Protein kinase domain containing protein [Leishmania naiffi]|uniref:Protein kinase domain-containing protein n=1 Tax=Leishmania naiffi TaxID=5678 RepID=A0AAW3BW03_9TRYP
MSTSDLLTDAYHSSESSAKALSFTLTDAHCAKCRKALKASIAPFAASSFQATRAAMMDDDLTTGLADLDFTAVSAVCSPTFLQREFFEASITSESAGGSSALFQSVVNRRDISLADISRMRWEGCRARHTSFTATASLRGSTASSLRSTSALPINSLTCRMRDQAGVFSKTTSAATPVASQAPAYSPFIGLGGSIYRRRSLSSARTSALDTSAAILQHMAYDTAAHVEAVCNASSLAGTPSTATSACDSVAPPPLQPTPHHLVHTDVSAHGDKVVECGNSIPLGDSCNDSDQHASLLQVTHTRPYASAANSPSPLNSFSELELRNGQLSAGDFLRLSAQTSATCLANDAVVAKGASDSQHSSSLPRLGGPLSATRRQAHDTRDHRTPCPSEAAAALLEVIPTSTAAATTMEMPRRTSPRQTRDVSVYNHDFQHIVPPEVKRALQRNMCPICEDDEDDDALLRDGLTVQRPPPLTSFANGTHLTHEDHCSLDTPPLYVYARGVASRGSGAGTTISFPSGSPRAPSQLSTSPSAPALSAAASSIGAWHAGGTGGGKSIHQIGSGSAETMMAGLSISGTGVPFQTWKFPSLGKPSSTSSLRKTSLGEHGNAEALPGSAVGGAGPARQSAAPFSEHSSYPTRASLTSGSRQQQCSEYPLLNHNGLEATSRGSTLTTVTTPYSPVAAIPQSGADDVGHCATSLFSGVGCTHQTASGARGNSIHCTSGASRGLTQRAVAADSSSGTVSCSSVAADGGNTHKLEMVCTAYERLLRARLPANSVAAAFPKTLQTLISRNLTETVMPPLHPSPSAHSASQTPQVAATTPVAAAVGFESASQGDISPSMSYSGTLGRSAGYYSFGKRISLSHPNRQTLPHQFLGSTSNSHTVPSSPRMAMLSISAVADLIVASSGKSRGPNMTSSSTARVQRGTLDLSLLRRTESRPLLQLTLFLQSNLRSICEAQSRHTRTEREEGVGRVRGSTSTSLSTLTATAVNVLPTAESAMDEYLHQYTFPEDAFSTAGAPSPARVADVRTCEGEARASQMQMTGFMAIAETASSMTLASAVTTVSAVSPAQESNRTSNSSTHVPSSGSILQSPCLSSTGKRANVSSLPVNCAQDEQNEQEQVTQLPKQTEMCIDPTADAAAAVMKSYVTLNNSPTAAADASAAHERDGGPPHRYYRALTEAERLVRHVHCVDGVEREVDNDSMDLVVYVGMHLMGWLEVVGLLGCGSFGQVFLCKDLRICDGHFVHPNEIEGEDYEYWNCSHAYLPFSSVDAVPTHRPLVAVKVVKSVPLLEQQSVLEAEMLVLIGAQTAPPSACTAEGASESATPTSATAAGDYNGASSPPPEDLRCANIAKVLADGICYGHHCIVMERYGANLYEYIAANDHQGLPMYQIRAIGAQLFSALSLVHEECHIIHADIKPENVLLALDFCRTTLRVKDEPLPRTVAVPTTKAPAGTASNSNSSTIPVTTKTLHSVPPQTTSARAVHGSQRDTSPNEEPPWHQQRTESMMPSSSTPAERSYITLRVGPGAVARQRLGLNGKRRSSNVLLDASFSEAAVAKDKGHGFCHLRSFSTNHATIVEHTDLPTPEPRRLQALNQSCGMLSSGASGTLLQSLGSGSVSTHSRFTLQAPAAPVEEAPAVPAASATSHLHVRLIDFSSSCYDGGPFYQYIQSRYYRAPEVIVGASYNSAIDVWSTGCLLAELLLGMPLLPGCNDHHQLSLIEEMVDLLPDSMVESGDNAGLFYTAAATVGDGSADTVLRQPRSFVLRTRENYLQISGGELLPYNRYFTYQTLQELVRHCPLTLEERRMSNGLQPYVSANESSAIPPDATPLPSVRSDMMKQRFLLFDLLKRLLQTDPTLRPTAAQALKHPFFSSSPPYFTTFALE